MLQHNRADDADSRLRVAAGVLEGRGTGPRAVARVSVERENGGAN